MKSHRYIQLDNLVGKRFSLDDTRYTIVDVRNITGDTLIYAEPVAQPAGPGRAAFRYVDIEPHLESPPIEAA